MQEFQAHVDCLENNNQTFFNCRRPEQKLNSCIFDKLVRPDISISLLQPVKCTAHVSVSNFLSRTGSEEGDPRQPREPGPCVAAAQADVCGVPRPPVLKAGGDLLLLIPSRFLSRAFFHPPSRAPAFLLFSWDAQVALVSQLSVCASPVYVLCKYLLASGMVT